jgi:hypothetical protein
VNSTELESGYRFDFVELPNRYKPLRRPFSRPPSAPAFAPPPGAPRLRRGAGGQGWHAEASAKADSMQNELGLRLGKPNFPAGDIFVGRRRRPYFFFSRRILSSRRSSGAMLRNCTDSLKPNFVTFSCTGVPAGTFLRWAGVRSATRRLLK